MPRPNALCRFSMRSRCTSSASGNIAGSRLAAGNGRSIQSPSFIGQPLKSKSLATRRAIVTGAYARRNSSTAVSMSAGSAASRLRSSGFCARCQSDAPIADHVVSMPATISSTIVPRT